MADFKVVDSVDLSDKYNKRYIVVDAETGVVLSVQFSDKDHSMATNLPLVLHLGQKLEENILV